MEPLLPIGSIIRLRNGKKRVMICGRLQQRESDQKVFDYAACLYPEGILDPEQLFLFQHENIEEIFFMGYQDEEETYIQKQIDAIRIKIQT